MRDDMLSLGPKSASLGGLDACRMFGMKKHKNAQTVEWIRENEIFQNKYKFEIKW